MIFKKLLYGIFWVTLAVTLFSCAGTKKDENIFSEPPQEQKAQKNSQKDEMAELEALLGIKREDTKKKETPPEEIQDKKLGLLGADEGKGTTRKEKIKEPVGDVRLTKLQKENEHLRGQLKEKDQRIKELQSEIDALKEELNRLSSQKSMSAQPAESEFGMPKSTMSGEMITYDMSEYKAKYQEALAYFNQRNYDAALNIFENLLRTNTNNDLADNIQYWIGECHYMQGKYQMALTDFEKVFTFPKSNKNDYAQFKIALCYLRLGQRDRAREELQRFLNEYPDSSLRSRAMEIMGKI